MNKIRLTIITVTKDDPIGLARTVASTEMLGQTWIEHLVIDGSVNPEAVKPWTGTDQVNIAVHARTPRGIADAFNFGVGAAQGEWLWFLNGGDCVDPDLTAELLGALLENTRADVIVGAITYEGENAPRPHLPASLRWPPLRSWIPHPSTLVRRRLFTQFGPFDERYRIAMDYEWWLRALNDKTQVDVLSVPFARFALGGVSQRRESLPLIAVEKGDAIRRHQVALWKSWWSRGGRLLVEWIRALGAPRVKKRPNNID